MSMKKIKAWAIVPNKGEYKDLQPTNHYFVSYWINCSNLFLTKRMAEDYVDRANWKNKVKIVSCLIIINPPKK